MFSLRAPIFESSNFVAETHSLFLDQTSNDFNKKFGPQSKDQKSSYQVKQVLSFICKLVTLILD